MSLDELPTEIITKILSYLTTDKKGFIGLSSACKRFNQASQDLVHSDVWCRDRPFIYKCLFKHSYKKQRYGQQEDKGHAYRLICRLLRTKYRNFSTLEWHYLHTTEDNRAIINALEKSLGVNEELTKLRLSALTELKLFDCCVSLKLLNRILSELVNLSYLTLSQVYFDQSTTLFDPKDPHQNVASKRLKYLKIENLRGFGDYSFNYFLDNFPSSVFSFRSWYNIPSQRDGRWLWSFAKTFIYLKKHQAILVHFMVDSMCIRSVYLKEILLEDKLKNLKISVRNCSPRSERNLKSRLLGDVGAENLARVKFIA